jgi:hypothetical protein
LKVLALQHVEIHRLTQAATVALPPPPHKQEEEPKPGTPPPPTSQTFPAGSLVIRMDQPFSRVADALLDRQFWSPEDPQKKPYDDTGWSFADLFNADVARVTDRSILTAPMLPITDLRQIPAAELGAGPFYVVNNSAQVSLASLVYALRASADVLVCEEKFESAGHKFAAGSLIIGRVPASKLKLLLEQFGLDAVSMASSPSVTLHPAAAPRIAFMHTWLDTQREGWWRLAFDQLQIPFTYLSAQTVAREENLRSTYDVIVFAPVGDTSTQQIVDGLPMWGNPLPWRTTSLTPNLGKLDETEDLRPGLGEAGVVHLKDFVQRGGLLITAEDAAEFAINEGIAPGVFVSPKKTLKVIGSVLNSVVVDDPNPIAYGYDASVPLYSAGGLAFTVSNLSVSWNLPTAKDYKRPTGRGGPEDEDIPAGRLAENAPPLPAPKAWQPVPLNEDQERNNPFVIPASHRPRVILRYAAMKDLLLSGLLENGDPIAEYPAVVQAHFGKGEVLLFANNPMYRGETIGSYALVFNALINFGHLQ